ncbi:MAG: N-acetyl-gamma-glutamyl-phosphate reductase [Planctomycetaceae bacterium]|jgi:N-acetyl-gamma-glutamyl-phosphate reductase|nr:N-acetyl-gamma-glutamyl-phosphate reductase [Planctomycetaceae bacterium]
MTTIAILGATGYTALELIKILLRHPNAEITALTSREDKRNIGLVHPALSGRLDLSLENLSAKEIANRAECVFSCLPHTASAKIVPELLHYGTNVIDLSADYRLDSVEVFETWYAEKHPDPKRLGNVPYGLPELFRDQIIGTNLIANPGCYPTSAILPLTPLIKTNLIEPEEIIIDSKSGVSGAGRTLKLSSLYAECNENIAPYGLGTHRHTPEIEQIITTASGKITKIIFTPHLTPMNRGILSTIYAKPLQQIVKNDTQNELLETLRHFYRDEPFVKIVEHLPSTKDVSGTNFVHITVRVVGNRIIIVSAIDNLIKGASGAAVQNFNLMFRYPETTALI